MLIIRTRQMEAMQWKVVRPWAAVAAAGTSEATRVMQIRTEQMQALAEVSRQGFAERVSAHLRKYYPWEMDELAEERPLEFVLDGIRRGEIYGIVSERDVCIYIELMVVFGRGFDGDAALPWAGAILSDAERPHPADRIEALYVAAQEYEQKNHPRHREVRRGP